MSKVLAVGDIHTKTEIINNVLTVIDNYDYVVFVGDYADDWGKGPDATMETWRHLRSLQDVYPDKVKLVTGNHDFLYAFKEKGRMASGWNNLTQLLLGADVELMLWVRNLPVAEKIDGVTYSHAGFTTNFTGRTTGAGLNYTGNDLWESDSPIWTRPGDTFKYEDYPQVFGHTPSITCWEVQPNVWCIDTFSTYPDGTPFGDKSVLEVVDGKKFNVTKLS